MNEPTKPTYEELEQTCSVLRQQRNALSSQALDWEGRCAIVSERLKQAEAEVATLKIKEQSPA